MTGLSAAAWEWAVGVAWQAALLALVAAAADRLLARRGLPHLRHALWLLVLAKFALPPTLASPWSVAAAMRGPAVAGAAVGDASPAAPADPGILPVAVLAAWIVGAAVVAVLAVHRSLRLRGALLAESVAVPAALEAAWRRAAATMRVRRPPRLVVSRAATGTALCGAFRAIVVVPTRRLSRREAEHAFLHELAHHRRRDLLVALAATVVRCIFWWHPAAWVAAARLADLREQCCDADVAAALGPDATAYRETLFDAARRLVASPERPRVAGIAWLGGRSRLAERLAALSHTDRRRTGLQRVATIASVAVAAACAVPMGAPADPRGAVTPAPAGAPTVPEVDVASARRLLEDALAGRTRSSCFQTRYAALRLAAAAR